MRPTPWPKFIHYRPQRSWAKVIFSQACVCPRGVCLSACWDTPPQQQEQTPPRADTPLEQTPRGADPPPSRHLPGSRPLRSRHPHPPGADTPQSRPPQSRPPPGRQTPAYGLRAAGTHPTGMHSCFHVVFAQKWPNNRLAHSSIESPI